MHQCFSDTVFCFRAGLWVNLVLLRLTRLVFEMSPPLYVVLNFLWWSHLKGLKLLEKEGDWHFFSGPFSLPWMCPSAPALFFFFLTSEMSIRLCLHLSGQRDSYAAASGPAFSRPICCLSNREGGYTGCWLPQGLKSINLCVPQLLVRFRSTLFIPPAVRLGKDEARLNAVPHIQLTE